MVIREEIKGKGVEWKEKVIEALSGKVKINRKIKVAKDSVTFGMTCIVESRRTGYLYCGDGHMCQLLTYRPQEDEALTISQLKGRPWSLTFTDKEETYLLVG